VPVSLLLLATSWAFAEPISFGLQLIVAGYLGWVSFESDYETAKGIINHILVLPSHWDLFEPSEGSHCDRCCPYELLQPVGFGGVLPYASTDTLDDIDSGEPFNWVILCPSLSLCVVCLVGYTTDTLGSVRDAREIQHRLSVYLPNCTESVGLQ
jgi:hypothetical protein